MLDELGDEAEESSGEDPGPGGVHLASRSEAGNQRARQRLLDWLAADSADTYDEAQDGP